MLKRRKVKFTRQLRDLKFAKVIELLWYTYYHEEISVRARIHVVGTRNRARNERGPFVMPTHCRILLHAAVSSFSCWPLSNPIHTHSRRRRPRLINNFLPHSTKTRLLLCLLDPLHCSRVCFSAEKGSFWSWILILIMPSVHRKPSLYILLVSLSLASRLHPVSHTHTTTIARCPKLVGALYCVVAVVVATDVVAAVVGLSVCPCCITNIQRTESLAGGSSFCCCVCHFAPRAAHRAKKALRGALSARGPFFRAADKFWGRGYLFAFLSS